jgi:hypothetical protein
MTDDYAGALRQPSSLDFGESRVAPVSRIAHHVQPPH